MSNEETKAPEKKETESSGFDLKEFTDRLWRAKYWILLSVIVCCGFCYYQYKLRAPLYKSTSEVLFLVGGGGTSSETNATLNTLSDLGVGSNIANINLINELQIFQSPALMAFVVEDLNLNTLYTTDGFGHSDDLYGQSPVLVSFLDLDDEESASFQLKKVNSTEVIASNFTLKGTPCESKTLRIPLNAVVSTPIGKISVSPTTEYSKFPEVLYVNRKPVMAMAESMSGSVSAEGKQDMSAVMLLSYTDVNSKRANDVVNGLVTAYNKMTEEEQTRSAVNTSNFIKDRIAVIEKELNGIDTDISQVKRANPTGDVTGSAFYNQSMTYDSQAYETSTQISIAQFLRDHILQNPDAMIPANTGASGSVEAMIQEYNKMLVKRDNLLQNSTPSNPVIAQMNADLSANRNLILQSLGNTISTMQMQASRAAGRGNSFAGKATAVPEQERQILSIERQQKVKENLYVYLLQKREENELARMVTLENTKVLRRASAAPAGQTALTQMLLIGLLVGLAIPAAIIFLLMQFNTKVTRKQDLSQLSVPFLGEMPLSAKRRKKKFSLRKLFNPGSRKADDAALEAVVKERSRSYINEAFRMIRTNLDFMSDSEDERSQVIILTSFNPGSGKTFISMNLAKSLAIKGKKVIVIDADLRRASLSKYAGNATQGLSTYLTGKAPNVNSLIVYSDAHLGVDVLPVGAVPPNPVELLLGKRFDKLIDELREMYDYIVIDCPPYDLVADTAILARVADMSIFVIRAGLFAKSMLPELDEIYKEGKLPRMSIILNGIDPSKSYYNSRYGYNGHNGYYINDDDEKK